MSKKLRTQINEIATWVETEAKTNALFVGYEAEQTALLAHIETIAKETDMALVDDLKKKITAFTRFVFKISSGYLKQFKERKAILEAEGKAKDAAENPEDAPVEEEPKAEENAPAEEEPKVEETPAETTE